MDIFLESWTFWNTYSGPMPKGIGDAWEATTRNLDRYYNVVDFRWKGICG